MDTVSYRQQFKPSCTYRRIFASKLFFSLSSMPPSQAFEARFVGYLHVASLSVSVVRYFPFSNTVSLATDTLR